MRFYIASNYERRDWLRENVVPKLPSLGHENVARWVTSETDMEAWDDRSDLARMTNSEPRNVAVIGLNPARIAP